MRPGFKAIKLQYGAENLLSVFCLTALDCTSLHLTSLNSSSVFLLHSSGPAIANLQIIQFQPVKPKSGKALLIAWLVECLFGRCHADNSSYVTLVFEDAD